MTRTGDARAGPAELVEQLHQPPLDQPGVPGGVLGLDRQLDPPVESATPRAGGAG